MPNRESAEGGSGADDAEGNPSDEDVETPDKLEYHVSGWTEVQHKKAHSKDFVNKQNLTSEQQQTVKMAAESLTKEQRQKYQQRQEKVRPR